MKAGKSPSDIEIDEKSLGTVLRGLYILIFFFKFFLNFFNFFSGKKTFFFEMSIYSVGLGIVKTLGCYTHFM